MLSMAEAQHDEKALIQAARSGDQAAFARLYDTYHRRIYATAVHFLGWQDPEAEDVLQEAFTRAWSGLKDFRGESSFYTWVNQICVHLCYRRVRKRGRQCGEEAEALERLAAGEARRRHQDESEAAVQEQRLVLLRQAIADLDEPCRSLVKRRDLEGLPYAGLSEEFKIPLGTVMSRLARCRETLRKRLLGGGRS